MASRAATNFVRVMSELSGFVWAESFTSRYGLIDARAVGNAAQVASFQDILVLVNACSRYLLP